MAEESNQISEAVFLPIPSSSQLINDEELPESIPIQIHSPTSYNEDKDMSSDELVIDLGQEDSGTCSVIKKRKR